MNIVQKVNSREIIPRHNNYQEVTIDAAGAGPIINFKGVHTRNSGLPGFSPFKQTSGEFDKNQELKNKAPKRSWYDRISDWGHLGLDLAGMIPVVGVAADLVNAGWYGAEGGMKAAGWIDDVGAGEGWKSNMALSGLAAIPGVGQVATAAKLAKKGVSYGKKMRDVAKWKNIKNVAGKNKLMTGVDAAVGVDIAQADLTGEEGLFNKDFGYNLKSTGISPFVGDEEGKSGITNPFTGKKASALVPLAGETAGKIYGGVFGGGDSDDEPTTAPVVREVKKDKTVTEKPNYLKYQDKMRKLQKDRGFNLKY